MYLANEKLESEGLHELEGSRFVNIGKMLRNLNCIPTPYRMGKRY